jgi:hypothetical protein
VLIDGGLFLWTSLMERVFQKDGGVARRADTDYRQPHAA